MQNYTIAGRGLIAAYDFALYYILRRTVESGDFSELNENGRVPGLIGRVSRSTTISPLFFLFKSDRPSKKQKTFFYVFVPGSLTCCDFHRQS